MNNVRIFKDDVAEHLDEVALIAAAYKSCRDAGRPTNILRRALLDAAEDALTVAREKLDATVSEVRHPVEFENQELGDEG